MHLMTDAISEAVRAQQLMQSERNQSVIRAQQLVHRARLQRPRRVTKRRVAAPIARVDVGTMLQQQPERASVT